MTGASAGRRGELRAALYLEEKGWRILERNWRCRMGEIDLIALDGKTLVFVEVKTRSSAAFGTAKESVDARKRQKLARAAAAYLASGRQGERALRFDVVAVESGGIEHLQDAFPAEGFTL